MFRALFAIGVLLGCQGESKAPAAERRQATLAVPARTVEPSVPRQDPVVLLEPGGEPRSPLRYAIAPGSAQRLQVETRAQGRQLTRGAWSELAELPVLATAYAITAEDGGALAVDIAGRGFRLLADDQHRFGGLSIAGPGPSDRAVLDDAAQRLLALAIPVPREPIGVGARWRVTSLLRQRPALVKQTATYTLVARDAGRWTIGVELARIAEPQPAEDPGLPPDTTVDVVALVVRFVGQLHVDPSRPLPTGELATTSTMHLKVRTPGRVDEQIFEDQSRIQIR